MPAAPDDLSVISAPPGVPALLRDLVHERTGIYFGPERFDTLLEKLRDRVVANELRSYLDYYYQLKYEDAGRQEWLRVMDAFSVQETYFWREEAQIRALVQVIVPTWFRSGRRPLRIWSAACASGEEPYSLAIALQEAGWGRHPITISASDASEAALAKAAEGIYRERSFRALPPELRARYFEPAAGGSRLLRDRLLPVEFHRANLVSAEDIAALARAQIIFCRNVFIYFSPEAIRRTVGLFDAHMPAGGYLMVGAAESLLRVTNRFELREIGEAFVYERKPRESAA